MSIYDFKAITIDGDEVSLEQYRGKVIVIVNTASKCGFTPQYEGLEKLYEQYKDTGFEILGFPSNQFAGQEPSENIEIQNFCKRNYGVSFQLFEKGDVRGENILPLFKYLTEKTTFKGFDLNHPIGKKLNDMFKGKFTEFMEDSSIKWNFTKFLIDSDGNIANRYEPTIEPSGMAVDIEKLISQSKAKHIHSVDKLENELGDKMMYIGENDEEVLNCEGGPCNFVYNEEID
ncbi:glutathione peroxidase [Clostridium frigoris]|uniref:Glutathione peroxidase n=1 Tax=Clostridium frigoris TaxID=205327 RepID=A0ABS6BWV9_9CLOT|nr:glutathione peroxidase [Clostridium frigoris]